MRAPARRSCIAGRKARSIRTAVRLLPWWRRCGPSADVREIDTKLSRYPVFGDRMGKDHMSSIDYTA
jgi:hypothetical protein